VFLIVTGSNFDAVFFSGKLHVERDTEPTDEGLQEIAVMKWAEAVRPVPEVPDSIGAVLWNNDSKDQYDEAEAGP
jgi:hypothetical protein